MLARFYDRAHTIATTGPAASLPYDTMVDLAQSALAIKGYGPIKEQAIARWRAQVDELRRAAPATATGLGA